MSKIVKDIISNRLAQIRRGFKSNTDVFLVSSLANTRYLTGFTGDDSWVLVTGRGVYLITDSRYTEQDDKECASCKIIERNCSMAGAVAGVLKKQKSVKTVAVEKSLSLAQFAALKKSCDVRFKQLAGIVQGIREIKDKTEVSAVRRAIVIAKDALAASIKYAKAGITENELAGRIDFEIRKRGAVISFDTIVAFGANASRPHHQPGGKKLKANDTILIDYGAKVDGYCCDLTRCFVVGKATAQYKKAYNAVMSANAVAIKMVKAGVKISDVDAAARAVIADADFPAYGHGTGHGLGLEVHELPVVSARTKDKLQAGQIITIEPGVYIPGKFGIRIEDDVLVTQTGCELLSKSCQKMHL